MRVLLLNPPGSRNYLRDYYCATVSKSAYYYHPVDLLYLSGTLSREHEVLVLDALARRVGPEAALAEAVRLAPEVVVSLVSAPSFQEDAPFLAELKRRLPGLRLVGTGDVFREFGTGALDLLPCLEAGLTDFSTQDLLLYLRGAGEVPVDNVLVRRGAGRASGEERHSRGSFSVPPPRIDLFPAELYSFPFVLRSPFMTVLSDFGCPGRCSFCPVSTLGFKLRPVEEVLVEIRRLWEAGYREVHFRDQTFGMRKSRTLELCAAIAKEFPRLTWSCFTRVDVLDAERAAAMRSAGCHTVIVGIEFDDDALQRELGKRISRSQMRSAVRTCRENGLRIAGTFLIGLPHQDERDVLAAGRLARELGLDYASFNAASPRMGTPLRRALAEGGEAAADRWRVDGAGAWARPKLTEARLRRLRARVELGFYLRPGYLLRRLASIRSPSQAWELVKNGISVLFR